MEFKVLRPFANQGFAGRTIEGESMTVPEQSMTIQELFARYKKGLPLGLPAEYDDEYDDDDPRSMEVDPTRRPDFDLADYTANMEELALLRRKAAEQEAENASKSQSDVENEGRIPSESADTQQRGSAADKEVSAAEAEGKLP